MLARPTVRRPRRWSGSASSAVSIAGCVALTALAAAVGALAGPGVQAAVAVSATSTAAPGVAAAGVASGEEVPVAAAPTGDGRGFWVASTDGSVTAEGDAVDHGDASGLDLAAPVVGIATAPPGTGYWLLGADGGVFSYGGARFYGSTGADHLVQPALQLVPTVDGHGYWFVARDGGVFTFGDARFLGSTGGLRLARPVVGMAATPDGDGYWLVGRDGGVFSFGDARFFGSTGGIALAQPIVGMARTGDGGGYWMVARDGGIFAFGDARFYGSAGGRPTPAPAIGMVATGDGNGYWIVLADGQVLPYGDATTATSPIPSNGWSLVGQVVTIDPGHDGGNAADPAAIDALVPSGPGQEKACDTVGAETDAGYPEHAFTFDEAGRLAAVLEGRGATVVLTRTDDTGVGPCVDVRAYIGNAAESDAALSIHGDGGPSTGRGFAVLEPADFPGYNDAVASASQPLGADIRDALLAGTPLPTSDYDGVDGLDVRDDLGGLNLSTVPKVLVEVGNMRNSTDAALEESPAFRQQAAVALADGLSTYLVGGS